METIIDPDWAWSEFKPDEETPWNMRTVAHLFRRAGFGATVNELTVAGAVPPAGDGGR